MFSSEMIILMAMALTRDSGNKLLTHPMDVTDEYIGYLYDSLVKRGYLKKNGTRAYQLTPKGKETLFEFLHQNKSRFTNAIRTLQQLDIEISQDVDKLVEEAIGAR